MLDGAGCEPRFRTDAALPGVERIAVTKPDSAFLEAPYKSLPPVAGIGHSFCHDVCSRNTGRFAGSWLILVFYRI